VSFRAEELEGAGGMRAEVRLEAAQRPERTVAPSMLKASR
jgi:hypothetical protein